MAIPKILRPLFGPRRKTNEIPNKYDKNYNAVVIADGTSVVFNVKTDMETKHNLLTVVVDTVLVYRADQDYTVFRNTDTEGITVLSGELFESTEFEHDTFTISNSSGNPLTVSIVAEGL